VLLRTGEAVGHYRVNDAAGEGSLGRVYLVDGDGIAAALEVLGPPLATDAAFVSWIEEEVRGVSPLRHPHVAAAREVLRARDLVAVVADWRPGQSFEALYPGGALAGDVGPDLVALLGAQIAEGLAAAHALAPPRTHRGVSPRTLRIGLDGIGFVTDFGFSSARQRFGRKAPAGLEALTPYLAPEQAEGGTVDVRSDVWSVGVVLWELLARSRLFRRESRAETLEAIQWLEVPLLEDIRDDVPAPLEEAIRRSLERDPSKRWASMQALAAALRANVRREEAAVRKAVRSVLEPERRKNDARIAGLVRPAPAKATRPAPAPPRPPAAAKIAPAPPAVVRPPPAAVAPVAPVVAPAAAPIAQPLAAPPPQPPIVFEPIADLLTDPTAPFERPASSAASTPTAQPFPGSTPRRRVAPAVAAVAVLAALGVAALVVVGPGGDPDPVDAARPPAPATSAPALPAPQPLPAVTQTTAPVPEVPRESAANTGSASLRVEANRMQAWVEVNGGPRRILPAHLEDLPRGTVVGLKVGAPGCPPRTLEVIAGDAPRVRVWLGAAGETPPAAEGGGQAADPADRTFRPLDEGGREGLERSPF